MSDDQSRPSLKLDPWTASSLLQKAIRRGEVGLAQHAAELFRRYRGNAIWRRLMVIAAEDIGIADISLLHEVVRLGSDKELRSILGYDADLIAQLCERMANAPKDRSCDYLYCSATRLPAAKLEEAVIQCAPFEHLVELAADDTAPIIKRAVAALHACREHSTSASRSAARRVDQLLKAMPVRHLDVEEVVLRLGAKGLHEFAIMLPLIWSRWWAGGAQSGIVEDVLPTPAFVGGIPLYVFDKHTAAGKQAITNFSRENAEVRQVLAERISEERTIEVANMAAFYADAVPVDRRLSWPAGELLAKDGFIADMVHAGCNFEDAGRVLQSIVGNLGDLNHHRHAAVGTRTRNS